MSNFCALEALQWIFSEQMDRCTRKSGGICFGNCHNQDPSPRDAWSCSAKSAGGFTPIQVGGMVADATLDGGVDG